MAEFIDDRKEYKKILRDIHIEKMRKNMKELQEYLKKEQILITLI